MKDVYDMKKNDKKTDNEICEELKLSKYKLRMIKKKFHEIENKNISSPSTKSSPKKDDN